MDRVSDADLVRAVAQGDREAVGALYDRYATILFPLALRILRDRSEAEDTVHDAFVTLAERAEQYVEARGSVAAWLVTLVRNSSIDRVRRGQRRGEIQREVVAHEPPAPQAGPEELAHAAASRRAVRGALAELAEVQRRTLEAAFFEGLSYEEIAAREGVPVGTIKSRAARAMATLRALLAQAGVDLDAL